MRKFFLALAMLPALALFACNKTQPDPQSVGGAIGTIGGAALEHFAPDIAAIVKGKCSFAITAANWFGMGDYPSVQAAAEAICASVNKLKAQMVARRQSTRGREATVTVGRAQISGSFVR